MQGFWSRPDLVDAVDSVRGRRVGVVHRVGVPSPLISDVLLMVSSLGYPALRRLLQAAVLRSRSENSNELERGPRKRGGSEHAGHDLREQIVPLARSRAWEVTTLEAASG